MYEWPQLAKFGETSLILRRIIPGNILARRKNVVLPSSILLSLSPVFFTALKGLQNMWSLSTEPSREPAETLCVIPTQLRERMHRLEGSWHLWNRPAPLLATRKGPPAWGGGSHIRKGIQVCVSYYSLQWCHAFILKKRWPKKQKHKNKCCKTCKYVTPVFFILQKNLASEHLTAQWKLHAIFKSECVCVIHVCFMYVLIDGIFIIYANTTYQALLQVFKQHIVYLL